jgi:hypothetical protein
VEPSGQGSGGVGEEQGARMNGLWRSQCPGLGAWAKKRDKMEFLALFSLLFPLFICRTGQASHLISEE